MFTHSKSILRPSVINQTPAPAKLLWISDLHFNIHDLWPAGHDAYLHHLSQQTFDHLVITGDISNAWKLKQALLSLSEAAAHRSVYFVLGNHDFFGSSFAAVDNAVGRICRDRSNLHHLGNGEIIELTNQTALIGHRGWADGKAGYGRNSITRSKERNWITDFRGLSKETVFSKMERLGEASGEYFHKMVPKALAHYDHLMVATHIPPFVWAAHTRERICRKTDLPFFTNISAGSSLKQRISEHPGKRMTVLCGHTHKPKTYHETPALQVLVAEARTLHPLALQ